VHGVDQSDDIMLLDIDVADGRGQEIVFRRHGEPRIAKENDNAVNSGQWTVNSEPVNREQRTVICKGRWPKGVPPGGWSWGGDLFCVG
jgi:hypothetical protein